MPRTYYQIELTARQLTLLLLLLGVAMGAAFVLGYGAAVAGRGQAEERPVLTAVATPTPVEETVVTPVPPAESVVVGRSGKRRPSPTLEPAAAAEASPRRKATATKVRPTPTRVRPTPTRAKPKPAPPAVRKAGLWVQVLAVSHRSAIDPARKKLEKLGFPRDHQRLLTEPTVGGGTLYKLRIGPFPDRASAGRVAQRMQASGFPDAWVVVK